MLSGETIEDALGLAGAPTGRIVFFENEKDVNADIIWRVWCGAGGGDWLLCPLQAHSG